MNLTWRLVISYLLIIIVSLSLAFIILLFMSRSIQSRLVRDRLAIQSGQVALQINDLYRQGVVTERIIGQLNTWSSQAQARLIFVNSQGIILADSQGTWVGQRLTLPIDLADPAFIPSTPKLGNFDDANKGAFVYAMAPVGPAGEQAGYVATVAPRIAGLGGVVAELGGGFLVAGLIVMLVSFLVGVVMARSIALPLQRLAMASSALTVGDYEPRLPETGPPEVKQMAASFNVMIERVENSQQVMRDFVSNVSHELKTPLTSIQGLSQAMIEGITQDEAARRRAANIVHEEASRLARLVEDLLDLARIDSGQIVMRKVPLDLSQILAHTVERLLPQATQKQVTLIKQWTNLPNVVGDGDRLAQVFTNLLDNAIRHTPAGGRVTLTSQIVKGLPRPRRVRAGLVQPDATTALSKRTDFVEISIADTGPGIPSTELARIFERFYQLDKSRKRDRGTGLGLAIAKEIVEAHGGYVRAESLAGQGSKFIVILPIREADVATHISPRH